MRPGPAEALTPKFHIDRGLSPADILQIQIQRLLAGSTVADQIGGQQLFVILSKECFLPRDLTWRSGKENFPVVLQMRTDLGIYISDLALDIF